MQECPARREGQPEAAREILIVDDEPMVLRLLQLSLQGAGYSVATASDGEQALAMLRVSAPQLLVTDLDMPRMDGRELIAAVEAEMSDRAFGIVLLTARNASEHRDWSGQVPGLSVIEKPVSMHMLLGKLEAHFAAARRKP